MPLAELQGLRETLHRLGSRANADPILKPIAELDAGKTKPRRLAKPD
jgi:antitoxin YefM